MRLRFAEVFLHRNLFLIDALLILLHCILSSPHSSYTLLFDLESFGTSHVCELMSSHLGCPVERASASDSNETLARDGSDKCIST